ncbi:glutamate--tRNA ligase [Candidatus Bathyarchaeota archaeon]|nr:glutamate--tRNA ligase [Candidatus Bathyarchaeota archaeon]
MSEEEINVLARRLALENAVQYGGKTMPGVVVGKILALRVELRSEVKELMVLVPEIVNEINTIPLEEQKRILATLQPQSQQEIKSTKEKIRRLPPLPNAEKYSKIHVRFSPNPDGALHLGSARAAILCDEYAKMYKGHFTLRFDDTDPKTKSPIPEAYDWIREDLHWLEADWKDEFYQSDRLEIYYMFAQKLLTNCNAYVCGCRPEAFRSFVASMKPCPCRDLPAEEHLKRWTRMLDGTYKESGAVLRIKTDLNHPNPAVREWPAFRIIDVEKYPHPRAGAKFSVWPLFAFCCGIDDHELGITHVIRGKEHLTNSVRQFYLYKHLGWVEPDAVHYGRLKIVGTILSKSKTREGLAAGVYTGWGDPRLGTLKALRRRGFFPETVRHLIIDIGPKPVDATISWVNVESVNRKLLDPVASRYFFVADPILMRVNGLTHAFKVRPSLHPERPEHEHRHMDVLANKGEAKLLVSKRDMKLLTLGAIVRLMELFNIRVEAVGETITATFVGESYQEAREQNSPLIHWVPADENVKVSVVMPDASSVEGKAEIACQDLKVDDRAQFERFGFVRIDAVDDGLIAYYTHR